MIRASSGTHGDVGAFIHGNRGREDTDECVRRDNVVVVRESGDGKKYERRAAPHGSGGRDRESEEGWSTHLGVDPGADDDVEQAEDGNDGEVARDVLDGGHVGEVGGPRTRGHGSDEGLRKAVYL